MSGATSRRLNESVRRSENWRPHWIEYGIEALALGSFMASACLFATLLFHPASHAAALLPTPLARQAAMGLLMAATLVVLVYSPWGRRSGAHMNPAFTLTFLRLGKIAPIDAAGYIAAQFLGAALGVTLAALVARMGVAHPSVNYVVTLPGRAGIGPAFAGEVAISFCQMLLVLHVASSTRWSRFTGLCAAAGLALYITFESPLSGTSMNPARSVASALVAGNWYGIWIYFTAPLVGMFSAAAWFTRRRGSANAPCGKMVHQTPCIFCEHVASAATTRA